MKIKFTATGGVLPLFIAAIITSAAAPVLAAVPKICW